MSAEWVGLLNTAAAVWAGSLWRACWQGGLVILLVWLLCRLRPRLSPAVRYWLWWLACAKLLLGLACASAVPLPVLPRPEEMVTRPAAPAPAPPVVALPQGDRAAGPAVFRTRPSAPSPASRTAVPGIASPPLRYALSPLTAAGLAWLACVLALLARGVRQSLVLRRLIRRSRPWEPGESGQAGVDGRIRIVESPAGGTPLVTGLLCPTIVLPAGLCRSFSGEEVRLALAHEMAHVRRGDLWLGLVPALAQTLFFFFPPAWLAVRECATAREEACDSAALRATGASAARYGQLLLKIVSEPRHRHDAAALGLSLGYPILRRRLLSLKSPPAGRGAAGRRAALCGLLAAGLVIVPWRLTARPVMPRPADGRGAASIAARYVLTDLGTYGGMATFATAINDYGEIVGAGHASRHRKPARAFLWHDGAMQSIGPLPRYRSNVASGINNRGQVILCSYNTANHHHAFLWGDGQIALGALPGYRYSKALGLNDRDEVVGYVQKGTRDRWGAQITRAFLWSGGRMRDLGTLGGDHSYALAINNRGEVAGKADLAPAPDDSPARAIRTHAFLWQDGRMVDLGTLPGGINSLAYRLNGRAQVVGCSETAEARHAFLWEQGRMRDLGALASGAASEAHGINDRGQVVGSSGYDARRAARHAFLYAGDSMVDLNSLTAASGWVLEDARDINNAGQIVGRGRFQGREHAFVLTPLLPPSQRA